MNILIEIPARGGSKGVYCKALRAIGGMPLIAYTIIDALNIKGNTRIIVNTDDPDIKEIALSYGAEVPFLRPASLGCDDSSLDDVVKYSSDWLFEHEGYKADIYIIMSPTNPFRRRNLVNEALDRGISDASLFNIGSVAPAEVDIDNFWVKKEEGMVRFSGKMSKEGNAEKLCQSSMSFNIVFNTRTELDVNQHIPVMLSNIEAIDVDERKDLTLARAIVSQGHYPVANKKSCNNGRIKNYRRFGSEYFQNFKKSGNNQFFKNTNFPLLSDKHFEKFKKYCSGKEKVVVTGCKTLVHPYRLRFIDKNGYSRFLYHVDKAIRGNRQSYPEVFSYVPAMLFFPAGSDPAEINIREVEMFEVESSKLIDSSFFPEGTVSENGRSEKRLVREK